MDYFLNSQFLWVGVALVSVPIIIHLINRLRFKRLRWAAMEFLLKAQKKNRRRLIIEQLILLALRCLLVALVGLLALRFTGFSFSDLGRKQALHIVLIDDTLSMTDKISVNDKDCFARAQDLITGKLAKRLSSTDKLLVLPLSKWNATELPPILDKLNDESRYNEMKSQVENLKPTLLHANLTDGVRRARRIADDNPKTQANLHILSDFRQKDWGLTEGTALHEELVKMARERKARIRLLDTAEPERKKEAGAPRFNDNVGIVDLRPRTRIVGKDTRVVFTIDVANYGLRDADVNVAIYDDYDGIKREEIDFNPPLPLKIRPSSHVQATFEFKPPTVKIKKDESYFASITARLQNAQYGPLTGDGLAQDNVAHAFVEVRDSVPVLIVDGGDPEDVRLGRDSFFLEKALKNVPGSGFQVDFARELAGSGGVAAKIFDRAADLRKYPTILIVNVRDLTPRQLANLEAYVKEGGGVGFFLGPQVSKEYYNEHLFKKGQGIFPVELKDAYSPAAADSIERIGTAPMLLLRDDKFDVAAKYPIFGLLFPDPAQRAPLNDLPVTRYFQSVRRPDVKEVLELATLPNDQPLKNFQAPIVGIVRQPEGKLARIMANPDFVKYRKGLERYRQALERLVAPPCDADVALLAKALHEMLSDKGSEGDPTGHPNLAELWNNADPSVHALAEEIRSLRDQAKFGDPFVVASSFGKGKVVAVMTTAGKRWTSWPGGCMGTATYLPFLCEMENYLSSQNADTNMFVGATAEFQVDTEPYKLGTSRLKMERFRIKPREKNSSEMIDVGGQTGDGKPGVQTFTFSNNLEPGVYVSRLVLDEGAKKETLAQWAQVFNVDTEQEGQLQRVSYEDVKTGVIDKCQGADVIFMGTDITPELLVPRRSDLSENPLFFLFFLAILVAEQALAVHLSFHLKGSTPPAA